MSDGESKIKTIFGNDAATLLETCIFPILIILIIIASLGVFAVIQTEECLVNENEAG